MTADSWTGRVSLRAFDARDEPALLAGRDDEWKRWLGPGHDHPDPTACILVDGEIVGWIDSDPSHPRLAAGETNVGYSVFGPHRGKGYATRAVVMLIEWLRPDVRIHTATLSIDPKNNASLRVAEKAGFARDLERDGEYVFRRPLR